MCDIKSFDKISGSTRKMGRWLSIFFTASVTAIAIQRSETDTLPSATAQPGATIVSSTVTISTFPSLASNASGTLSSTFPDATSIPTVQLVGLVESCTPKTICMDKISPCGKRYGGSVAIHRKFTFIH